MVRPFHEAVEVRDDVFDQSLDDKMAPSLGNVYLGKEHEIYTNPKYFFERTLLTSGMLNVLNIVANALSKNGSSKLVTLNSLFGGVRHTPCSLYITRSRRPPY